MGERCEREVRERERERALAAKDRQQTMVYLSVSLKS